MVVFFVCDLPVLVNRFPQNIVTHGGHIVSREGREFETWYLSVKIYVHQ